jgi:Zn-finger nucleic acid-binding protein
MDTPAACPSCRAPMSTHRFPRKTGGEVELDLCFPCQGIWFDEYESLQLAPSGVIDLFKLIHDHRDDQRLPLAKPLRCPRCKERMIHSQDRVRSGLFNYMRCGQHGRFITFSQFMIEKGFVRQLNGAEINELKARIGTIRCNGCGAPVDIHKESACGHCQAPIAILDPQAVEQALAGYHQAAVKQAAPADPAVLAETILFAERERNRHQRERGGGLDADIGDLLLDGVAMVWNLVKR